MRVVCVLVQKDLALLPSFAEACLVFSPQIALSEEAVFIEISGAQKLFSFAECLTHLERMTAAFGLHGRISCAPDPASALAFARYGKQDRDPLPIEALADFLQPFSPLPFASAPLFRSLGVATIGDFLRLPRRELSMRFGKEGL